MPTCFRGFAGLLSVMILVATGCSRPQPRVVLYCAQDRDFAEESLAEFYRRTGLSVEPKFDTEANKSVGLYNDLVKEKDRPRCDVFWNNEILGTIRLQKQGLLLPYTSPSAAPFPKETKASDNTWQAFAQRGRVLIVNTDRVPKEEWPSSILDLAQPRWKGRAVMAKPMHGTTATQAACLFEVMGTDKASAYYRSLKDNDVQIAPGNKHVAEWVGKGRTPRGSPADVGITDTDDAMDEVKKGRPVAIIFPDADGNKEHPRMGTLFIPNTLAIIRDCPNPEGARKLVDYLLGPEVEAKLAESKGYQLPLNPEVKANVPAALAPYKKAKPMQVDFHKAAELWAEAQRLMVELFAQ